MLLPGIHSEEWIAGVIEQVLGAVSYCHDRGVAHQDLSLINNSLSIKRFPIDVSSFF